MWNLIRNFGLMIIVASSIVLAYPVIQYEVCRLNLWNAELVQCSYFIGRTETLVLLLGNFLFLVGYSMGKLRKQR